MKFSALLIVVAALTSSGAHSAQEPVIIDLNEKPEPFSESDYSALVACTLEQQPDKTRRYADYHLNRRNVQTPEQNKSDPDSNLMIPVISTCYEVENGKPIPFSLDRLIGDWAKFHGVVDTTGVTTIKQFAACAARNHSGSAQHYVTFYNSNMPNKSNLLSLLIKSMAASPCVIRGEEVRIDMKELNKLLDKELRKGRRNSDA